jgi:hypothetical protein
VRSRRADLLDLSALERRIAACLAYEEATLRSGVRREALRPLHYLFLSGTEIDRGDFKSMLGLGDRTAESALSALIKRGLLKSDSPQGKLRFGLPLHALRFYFPACGRRRSRTQAPGHEPDVAEPTSAVKIRQKCCGADS